MSKFIYNGIDLVTGEPTDKPATTVTFGDLPKGYVVYTAGGYWTTAGGEGAVVRLTDGSGAILMVPASAVALLGRVPYRLLPDGARYVYGLASKRAVKGREEATVSPGALVLQLFPEPVATKPATTHFADLTVGETYVYNGGIYRKTGATTLETVRGPRYDLAGPRTAIAKTTFADTQPGDTIEWGVGERGTVMGDRTVRSTHGETIDLHSKRTVRIVQTIDSPFGRVFTHANVPLVKTALGWRHAETGELWAVPRGAVVRDTGKRLPPLGDQVTKPNGTVALLPSGELRQKTAKGWVDRTNCDWPVPNLPENSLLLFAPKPSRPTANALAVIRLADGRLFASYNRDKDGVVTHYFDAARLCVVSLEPHESYEVVTRC